MSGITGITMKAGDGPEVYIKPETLRQAAMPGAFRGMDEHFEMVVGAVREMASNLVDTGLTAKVGSTIEIAGQFATSEGVLMDSVIKITMSAKPAKVD